MKAGQSIDCGMNSACSERDGLSKTMVVQAWYPRQQVIELWHGIPLKGMDGMDATYQDAMEPSELIRSMPDLVLSSGQMYETLFSACRYVPGSRYRRFGFPRLRWLQSRPCRRTRDPFEGSWTPARRRNQGPVVDADPSEGQVQRQWSGGSMVRRPGCRHCWIPG